MIEQAVILAGGKGERLRPLTNDRPKSMVEAFGLPLIDHQLRWLKAHGILHVTIACGYLSDVVKNYCGGGSKWNLVIDYTIEETPLGRGGALKQALKSIKNLKTSVLCLNGDIIFDLNLKDLSSLHAQEKPMATVVCVPLKSQYGIVDLDENGRISRFQEKPVLPFWVNAGIYVLEPEITRLLPDKGDHEEATFPALAEQGCLRAFKSKSFWKSVETIKDLRELDGEMGKSFSQALVEPKD